MEVHGVVLRTGRRGVEKQKCRGRAEVWKGRRCVEVQTRRGRAVEAWKSRSSVEESSAMMFRDEKIAAYQWGK